MGQIIGITGLRGHGKDTAAAALMTIGFQKLAFAEALYLEVAQAFGVTTDVLGNRETKETPLPAFALNNCKEKGFVTVVLEQDFIKYEAGRAEYNAIRGAGLWAQIKIATKVFFGLGDFPAPPARPKLTEQLSRPRSPREIMQYWGTEYRRGLFGDSYWRDQVENIINSNPGVDFVITDVRFPDEAKVIERRGGSIFRTVRPGAPGANDKALLHSSEQAMLEYPVAATFQNEEGKLKEFQDNVLGFIHYRKAA